METLAGPRVSALVDAAVERGVPLASLLAVLQATRENLDDLTHRIPLDRFHEAWELAVATSGDDTLPVAAGRLASVSRFGVFGYRLYTSPTVRAALDALIQFHVVVHGKPMWSFAERDGGGVVTCLQRGAARPGRIFANEQALASLVQVGREVVGDALVVREAWLERPAPVDETAHREQFGSVVHWSAPATALLLAHDALDAAPRGADPLLGRYFAERADAAAREERDSWTARAARVIQELLPRGIPTAEEVATALAASERTLRRRLSEEGVVFADLVTQVQRERARDLLATGMAVRDVAFATGFADSTAFSRAYRRWTGQAPSASKKSV